MNTVDVEITIKRGSRRNAAKHAPAESTAATPRIPRITRLMALAIKFQDMVDRGEVRDYADLARLGFVTRARLTQIMNLLLLAPDVQEQLLFAGCRDVAEVPSERCLRSVASTADWATQRHQMSEVHQHAGRIDPRTHR